MAVPASGSLSLAALAAEKIENDYTDVDTSYGPYSLKDITVGGNASGIGGETYDVTNAISLSHPDNDAGYGMSEFYSYDHDFAAPGCNLAYESGQNGEFNYPVNLGTATGNIRIEYEAYGIPDRFEFTWNGNTYISGSSSGNYDGYVGSASTTNTNNLRTALGNNTVEIYSNNQGGNYTVGRGYIVFNKNSSVSTANMNVKAPINGTLWWFSVSCPGMQVISNNPGIAPSVTANTVTVSGASITMGGNVTNKGLTSNFSTAGTISSKGFVAKLGVTATAEFLIGESGVTNVPEDDSTIDTTGSFNESVASTVSTNGTITTNDASSVTETSFTGSLTKTSLGTTTPNSFRAYATNAAGTTYSSIINVNTTGVSDESGIVYCNQSYSSTPSVNNNSGSIAASTGNQWNQLQGTSTSTGTVSSTINESQVSLAASNTYRYRAVMRQSSTLHYGVVKGFTVAASYSYTATITVGSDQYYTTLAYGYADLSWPDMGSTSNTTFNSNTLLGMYWQNNSMGTDYVYLYFMGSKPSFTELIIGTTNLGASSTWTSNSTTSWRKAVSSNPFASVGSTTSIYANY